VSKPPPGAKPTMIRMVLPSKKDCAWRLGRIYLADPGPRLLDFVQRFSGVIRRAA